MKYPGLMHFVHLAIRGGSPGCSGGEMRARELAELLISHADGLDGQAFAGLLGFADIAHKNPAQCQLMLRGLDQARGIIDGLETGGEH